MTALPAEAEAAVGRQTESRDVVAVAPAAAFAATFGRDQTSFQEGDALPPLWHGIYGTAKLPPARLAMDGLPADETLLPGIPGFPRRVFGGARFRFDRPLRIGGTFHRVSEITGFDRRDADSGPLLIARIRHRISDGHGVAVVEENDILYRPEATGGAPPAAAPERQEQGAAPWRRTVDPDPVLMFRHSAVTFNANRLHYDRDFARARGLPGLVVQGMLVARLLGEMLRDEWPGREMGEFSFRARRPLYDTAPFTLWGIPDPERGTVKLWAADGEHRTVMTAEAAFR